MSNKNRRTALDDIAIANAQLIVALESAEQAMEKLAFSSRRAVATAPGISLEVSQLVNEYAQRDLGKLRLCVHQLMGSVRIASDKRKRGRRPVR